MENSDKQLLKKNIATEIKNINIKKVFTEWEELKKLSEKPQELECLNGRSKIGCDLIDYYFFPNRLETVGNKGIHFFEFIEKTYWLSLPTINLCFWC